MADENTLIDYFLANVEKFSDRVFMTQPMGGEEIKTFTFAETLAEAKKIAGYIDSLGLQRRVRLVFFPRIVPGGLSLIWPFG